MKTSLCSPICYQKLPDNVEISKDGRFAQELSGDFCQYEKVCGGWVFRSDVQLKKQQGLVPGKGIWIPCDNL